MAYDEKADQVRREKDRADKGLSVATDGITAEAALTG
jgi:hypothetical protein